MVIERIFQGFLSNLLLRLDPKARRKIPTAAEITWKPGALFVSGEFLEDPAACLSR